MNQYSVACFANDAFISSVYLAF